MRYSVVGAGAVGGYYGGRLAAAGRDVHFLARSDFDVLRTNDLQVKSCDGDFRVRIKVYRSASEMPRPDVVIVALKALDTPALAGILPHLLGPSTCCATLQNGLGNEEAIAKICGADRVIAGSAFICSEREKPGVVGHYAAGALGFAPFREGILVDTAIDRLVSDFNASGVKCRRFDSARTLKWGKLVWNVPFSGLAIYYGGVTTDVLMKAPEKREFARRLMIDILAAARADGAELSDDEVDRNFRATEKMGAYRPSMLVDFEKGRPMEIEAIIGEPLRRGRARGLTLPALEELYRGVRNKGGS